MEADAEHNEARFESQETVPNGRAEVPWSTGSRYFSQNQSFS